MRRWLRDGWREVPCRFAEVELGMEAANPQPVVVLTGPDGERHLLTVSTWMWRWGALRKVDGGSLWLAGSLSGGGVGALPGGAELFWLRRIRSAGFRRRIRKIEPSLGIEPGTAPTPELPRNLAWRLVQSWWACSPWRWGC